MGPQRRRGARDQSKQGPKGPIFKPYIHIEIGGPFLWSCEGRNLKLRHLSLPKKCAPLPCARGCLPCPFTTPLHGNTLQVSNKDTGQNILILKWYKWPLFSSWTSWLAKKVLASGVTMGPLSPKRWGPGQKGAKKGPKRGPFSNHIGLCELGAHFWDSWGRNSKLRHLSLPKKCAPLAVRPGTDDPPLPPPRYATAIRLLL